jgi:hypothetical protein
MSAGKHKGRFSPEGQFGLYFRISGTRLANGAFWR